MLKKVYRLRENSDFRKTYKKGKSYATSSLVLYATPNRKVKDGTICRVGYSVSKKIGKAVVRNKVKRRLREATCDLLPKDRNDQNSYFKPNYDYVIIAKYRARETSVENLQKQIIKALKAVFEAK